jgi:hypothetical protein
MSNLLKGRQFGYLLASLQYDKRPESDASKVKPPHTPNSVKEDDVRELFGGKFRTIGAYIVQEEFVSCNSDYSTRWRLRLAIK